MNRSRHEYLQLQEINAQIDAALFDLVEIRASAGVERRAKMIAKEKELHDLLVKKFALDP